MKELEETSARLKKQVGELEEKNALLEKKMAKITKDNKALKEEKSQCQQAMVLKKEPNQHDLPSKSTNDDIAMLLDLVSKIKTQVDIIPLIKMKVDGLQTGQQIVMNNHYETPHKK